MTNYGMVNGFFIPKPASVCLTETKQDIEDATGMIVPITGDTDIGIILGILSEREASIWQLLEDLYYCSFRETADEAALDNTLALIGKSRILQSNSTVTLTLYNRSSTSPVPVASDSQARQSSTGVVWETTEDAEIPALEELVNEDVTDIEWQTGNILKATFDNSPDLSLVAAGDTLTISGAANTLNNGDFEITEKNVPGFWVKYSNPDRSDNTLDETSATGITGAIMDTEISTTAAAQSLLAGAYEATAGTINTVVTGISGWDGVTNELAATIGDDQETDSEARLRAAEDLVIADGTTVDAVLVDIAAVDGVTYYSGTSVNDYTDPAWGYTFVVTGGADQDIWDAIGSNICGAIPTHGSEVGTWTDSSGNSHIVKFNRATEVLPYFIVNLTVNSAIWTPAKDTEYQALVRASMAAVSFTQGGDVLNHVMNAAVSNSGALGILTIEVLQGFTDPPSLTNNLTIAADEIARVSEDRITEVNT